jgi:dephospho-CoA kinase
MIIGVSGKIGSGKDVIGLCVKNDYDYTVIKFADKIKQIACLMTNTPMDLQTSQRGKASMLDDWGMTVREFQQKLGTDAVRDGLHKDSWVLATLSHYKPNYNWVVTDTRFINEAQRIQKLGGINIRVERPNNPFPESSHPSEKELDNYIFDYTVINDGSIDDLYKKIHSIMSFIKK